ncbi:MAG: FAD-dependent oxidoreductase [Patescibacteria group bacterium]|nr:FAD-dependent oxidoreductase [Patescibacteria group bacterium]
MTYDLAIIGGGPAGAAAAVYAARKQIRTVVIAKDWLGQSNVSEKIENWVGTVALSGLELSQALEKHAKAYGAGVIDFKDGEACAALSKSGDGFAVATDKGSYEARAVLIASGSSRRKLEVPGAAEYENKGVTYCATCDGPLYKGQAVAVIGGGNAGFEAAAQLLAYCTSVTLLSRSGFKADPGTVQAALKDPKMKAIEFAVPKEIKGGKFVSSLVYTETKSSTDTEIPVTGIFAEVGSVPNSGFAKGIAATDAFGHIVADPRNQRASVEGIWAAGDVTDGLYHQNNIAAGDAVKAIEDIYIWLHNKK